MPTLYFIFSFKGKMPTFYIYLFPSAVLSSCEPELRELMRQIDIMVNHQKKSWEAENHDLRVRLKSGQDDLQATSNIIKRRDLEVNHKTIQPEKF